MPNIYPVTNGLAIDTPFNRGFVEALKVRVPSHERKWDPIHKVWTVHPKHGTEVQKLIEQYFRVLVTVPQVTLDVVSKRGQLRLLYIGMSKEREDGTHTSFGLDYDSKEWNVIFPEEVLKNWFDGTPIDQTVANPARATYYAVLGLKDITDDLDKIKGAYRRMARQWHPDVCQEPDAEERFKKINEVYQILSDPKKRARYNAGLSVVKDLAVPRKHPAWALRDNYKPALRCGIVDCDYEIVMGRAFVKQIYGWDDITDSLGRTLVTSWRAGATEPTICWV